MQAAIGSLLVGGHTLGSLLDEHTLDELMFCIDSARLYRKKQLEGITELVLGAFGKKSKRRSGNRFVGDAPPVDGDPVASVPFICDVIDVASRDDGG